MQHALDLQREQTLEPHADLVALEDAQCTRDGLEGREEARIGVHGDRLARDEGFEEVAEWLETLARAEKSHAGRFQGALDTLS